MTDKLTDLQEKYNDQDKYREDLRAASDMKPEVPDFVTKTKEYIKLHPEVIREVAGDEIQKLEEWLDTFPVVGNIAKTKLNEFLDSGAGNGRNVQDRVKDAPGRAIEAEPEEVRDSIPKERWNEILASMVVMDDEGISPGRISDSIADDYGVKLSHSQIWHYIERYRRSLKAQEKSEAQERSEEEKAELRRLEIQKTQSERWKKLTDELETARKANIELEKKQAVYEALREREKENPDKNKNEKTGLIRWLWKKAY